jgi:hypothetical protein
LRKPGSFTSGEIVAVRLVGPSAPATNLGLSGRFRGPGVGAFARNPGRREIDVAHFRLQPVVGLRDARRVESVGFDDVGAGFEKRVVDRRDDGGLGQDQQVVVALQIARMVAESAGRRAAKVGLAELLSLDHSAHRAVEDEDAFPQQALQQFGLVGRRHRCAESEIRSIVRGGLFGWQMSRHAALLSLSVARATVSASRLAWRPNPSAPLSSELLTQHTSCQKTKKPVSLPPERVSGESRFSWICIAPASCGVTPESNRRWL